MALIDKDQLKAEIDKRYAEYRAKMKTDDFTYYEGMADALDLFEQFLDTLPDEPNHLEEALELVAEYNLKPYRDGNAWCILLGKDIQSGICGFGNTLTETYLDFLKSYKEYKHPINELLIGLNSKK